MSIERDHDGTVRITNEAVTATLFYHDGNFQHAYYTAVGSPRDLVRSGLCHPAATNRTGVSPSGQPRSGGRVGIDTRARLVIARDDRFCAALDRLVNGSAYPDISLPAAPRGRRLKRGSGRCVQDIPATPILVPKAPSRPPAPMDPATQCALTILQTLNQKLQELGLNNSSRLADQIRKEIEYRNASREDDEDEGDRVG